MLQQYYAFSLSFVFKALLINQTLYFQLFKEKKSNEHTSIMFHFPISNYDQDLS